jgi:hypothetical protein
LKMPSNELHPGPPFNQTISSYQISISVYTIIIDDNEIHDLRLTNQMLVRVSILRFPKPEEQRVVSVGRPADRDFSCPGCGDVKSDEGKRVGYCVF